MLASAASAFAQSLIDPRHNPELAGYFDPHPGDKPLHCDVTPIHPALNFSFRFQSGYVFRVPLNHL